MRGRRLETTGGVCVRYVEDCFEPRMTQMLTVYTHPPQAFLHPSAPSRPRPPLDPWDAPLPEDRSP